MKFPRAQTLKNTLSFLLIVAFFQAVGGLIGWVTAPGDDDWYRSLERAPLNPPDWVFGATWSTLYVFLAAALWAVWTFDPSDKRTGTLGLFAFHMFLNWSWNPVFFIAHEIFAAVAIIVVLIITALILAVRILKVRRWAAALFMPYIGWLCFALYLAGYIWLHNP